jgi:hypothetical protein
MLARAFDWLVSSWYIRSIMARERLIVSHILEHPDGKLVVALNAIDDALQHQWRNMAMTDLKAQFEDKKIHVFGEGYQFETGVLGVQISSSIAEFKNVYLKLDNDIFSQKIRMNDKVEVDL